jgi:hypothetical protein
MLYSAAIVNEIRPESILEPGCDESLLCDPLLKRDPLRVALCQSRIEDG